MKKTIKLCALLLAIMAISSCSFKKDNLEGSKIYTTVSPIKYIVNYLYGNNSVIESIYPGNADIDNYKLTKKQIKNYADSDLFVYNGLTTEKDIAKTLLNKNSKLLILDVSYGLTLNNDVTELWLSPNNYLMLAKNFKSNLEEYLNNRSLIEEIDENYADFEEKISILDASLHELGKLAQDNNKETIVTNDSTFKYLENYGFKIISLEDEANLKDIKLNSIKNNFSSGKYKYILTTSNKCEVADQIISEYKATEIKIDTMTTSMDNDYFNMMNEFLQNIKTIIS